MVDIVSWILTLLVGGAIGGAIAFNWQKRGWLFQQKLKRASDKYDAQIGLARDLFVLVDKRLYASRLYLNVILERDLERIYVERETYRKVVFDWNSNISGLIIMMISRYRSQTRLDFDTYFLPAFAELDRKLLHLRKQVERNGRLVADDVQAARGDLYRINWRAREFMSEMMAEARSLYRVIDEKPEIAERNISELTYWYLLKSLFEKRRQA